MNNRLRGLNIVNTRPLSRQGRALSLAIEQAGGTALHYPTLAIEPISFTTPQLSAVDYAIFVSPNAATYWFNGSLVKEFSTAVKVIAMGEGTLGVLQQYGIPAIIPKEATSECLLMLPQLQSIQNKQILLIKGEGGRHLIAETLTQRGAKLIIQEVYKRILPTQNASLLLRLQQEQVDCIVFTSQESMQNFFTLLHKEMHQKIYSIPCIVISQRLAHAASSLGMKHIILSQPNSILTTLYQFKQG